MKTELVIGCVEGEQAFDECGDLWSAEKKISNPSLLYFLVREDIRLQVGERSLQ